MDRSSSRNSFTDDSRESGDELLKEISEWWTSFRSLNWKRSRKKKVQEQARKERKKMNKSVFDCQRALGAGKFKSPRLADLIEEETSSFREREGYFKDRPMKKSLGRPTKSSET
jgi:hypothetical protein